MRKILALVALLVLVGCSSSAEKVEEPTACGEGDFSYSVGPSEGAAGTNYTPLIYTNTSDRACVFEGLPTAQPIRGTERFNASPQSQQNAQGSTNGSLTLQPGAQASMLFAVATASNYPTEECVPDVADGVKVTFKKTPGFTAYFTVPDFEVCTKLSNTFISGIVAGIQP